MNEYKKTIFLDIDGCILKHQGNLTNIILNKEEVLPGVIEKFNEWEALGYKIILTTGRKECIRDLTNQSLRHFGLFYNELIMECHRGERILINDFKPNSKIPTASAICIERNVGLENINI